MADYTSSSHPNPDLHNVHYSILAEAYAATPTRGLPLKVFTAVAASVVFLVSLIGLVVNHFTETGDHRPLTPSRVLSRGGAEGVSAKSFPMISDEGSYNWTNAMLSWQRTAYHFQPEKNWMNGRYNVYAHHLSPNFGKFVIQCKNLPIGWTSTCLSEGF